MRRLIYNPNMFSNGKGNVFFVFIILYLAGYKMSYEQPMFWRSNKNLVKRAEAIGYYDFVRERPKEPNPLKYPSV